jgi:hypothetical protein
MLACPGHQAVSHLDDQFCTDTFLPRLLRFRTYGPTSAQLSNVFKNSGRTKRSKSKLTRNRAIRTNESVIGGIVANAQSNVDRTTILNTWRMGRNKHNQRKTIQAIASPAIASSTCRKWIPGSMIYSGAGKRRLASIIEDEFGTTSNQNWLSHFGMKRSSLQCD